MDAKSKRNHSNQRLTQMYAEIFFRTAARVSSRDLSESISVSLQFPFSLLIRVNSCPFAVIFLDVLSIFAPILSGSKTSPSGPHRSTRPCTSTLFLRHRTQRNPFVRKSV